MIAEAIFHLSGLKIIALDRFDILDVEGRADMISWLDELAYQGEIETALLFGTLKSLSSGLPETVQAVWIENGHARHPGGGESGMRQLRMSLSNELIVDLFAGGHPIDVLTCDLAEAINETRPECECVGPLGDSINEAIEKWNERQ